MSTADTNTKQPTCKARVRSHYRSRLDELRELWHAYTHTGEECRVCHGTGKDGKYTCDACDGGTYPEDARLYEYGLCFDYVAPGTFNGQRRGYWRYQLSWGGPSDEFRFYCDERRQPVRIEYWFLDWFDGAKVTVKPDSADWKLLLDLWSWFDDGGSVEATYNEAS